MVRCGAMAVVPAVRAASAGRKVSTLGMVVWCVGTFAGCVTPGSRMPFTWRGRNLVCFTLVHLFKTVDPLPGRGAIFGRLFTGPLGVSLSRGTTAFETAAWCIGGGVHLPEVPSLDLLQSFVTCSLVRASSQCFSLSDVIIMVACICRDD